MGTSRNDRSPSSPPWKPALAVLGREGTPVSQQVREIWRAAAQDRGDSLLQEFGSSAIATAYSLAAKGGTIEQVLRGFDETTLHESKAGLAVEIARRALARTVVSHGTGPGFASEFFGEAASYYVARDLPSFIAGKDRVPTVSKAVELKNQIRDLVRDEVAKVPNPKGTADAWRSYVARVLSVLQGQEYHK